MLHALILIPLVGALIAGLLSDDQRRPLLLPLVALLHTGLTLAELWHPSGPAHGGWVQLDPLGNIVLLTISLLFLGCSIYAVSYLRHDRPERPNRFLCLSLLSCLAAMTLVCISQHLGLLWVAVAVATVSMAPQIYYNTNARSIEATWKYLLIGSVGIALALLGVYFLAYATLVAGVDATLQLESLLEVAPKLDQGWLRLGFVFLLVGFGVKLGLAPLHTWKPDAYGEAPGLVGGLLAGGLTSVAFLAILRAMQIMTAAGEQALARQCLLALGICSLLVAALFVIRQRDIKRMLAYSSVEHMGILAIGVAMGGLATYGAMFHLLNNALTKGALFMSAGNIHRYYGSKRQCEILGTLSVLPVSAATFLAGFLAITGSPPFAPFLSEFTILRGIANSGHPVLCGFFILLLVVIFIGMGSTVIPVTLGASEEGTVESSRYRETLLTAGSPLLLILAVFLLGIYLPAPLQLMFSNAAGLLEVPQ